MNEKKYWIKVAYSKSPYYVCISKAIQSPLRKTRSKRTEGSFALKANKKYRTQSPLETPSLLSILIDLFAKFSGILCNCLRPMTMSFS